MKECNHPKGRGTCTGHSEGTLNYCPECGFCFTCGRMDFGLIREEGKVIFLRDTGRLPTGIDMHYGCLGCGEVFSDVAMYEIHLKDVIKCTELFKIKVKRGSNGSRI